MYISNESQEAEQQQEQQQKIISIFNFCPPTLLTHAGETVMGKTAETVTIEAILLCNLTTRFLPRITQLMN